MDPPFGGRLYRPADEARVLALWHACNLVVPWNDPHRDIALKLAFQPDLFFVACDGEHGELVEFEMEKSRVVRVKIGSNYTYPQT